MNDPDVTGPLERLLAHRAWVRRVAVAMSRNGADAEDLEQEAWLRAIRSPPRADASWKAWFRTVLRRVAMDRRREGGRREARETAAARPDRGERTEDLVAEAEAHRLVVDAVLALDEPYRATLVLRYFHELPLDEVARRTGAPLETARTRVRRGLERLREHLGGEGNRGRGGWALAVLPLLRREELGAAGPALAATGGTTTVAATAAGAMIMGTGTKAAAAAVLAAAAWLALRGGDTPADPPAPRTTATASRSAPPAAVGSPAKDAAGVAPAASPEEGPAGAPAPGEEGAPVEGRVVAADGVSPVAGARLLVLARATSGALWTNLAEERGRSADDGTFRLERLPPGPSARSRTLLAACAGGVGWVVLPPEAGRGPVPPITVRIDAGIAVRAAVRDDEGRPVAGARVVASPRFFPFGATPEHGADHDLWIPEGTGLDGILAARTGADGVAVLPHLPTGSPRATYDFLARDDVGATTWKDGVEIARGRDATVDLVLGSAATWSLAGTVRDAEGNPVVGAEVVPAWGPPAVRTGEDGTFRIDGLQASWDRMELAARAPGFAPAAARIHRGPSEYEARDVDILLERRTPVSGRVVDEDGLPLSGVRVALQRRDRAVPASAPTDAAGRFALPDATAGWWTLAAWPPPPAEIWNPGDTFRPVRGGDEGVEIILRRVPPGRTRVVADVVDEATGEPLAVSEAMLVDVAPREGTRVTAAGYGALDRSRTGVLVLDRVKPGRWRFWVRVEGDRPPSVVALDTTEQPEEIRLRIPVGRAGLLRGSVTVPAGSRLPSMVFLERADERSAPGWSNSVSAQASGAATVARDGTFSFEGVPPARWRVRFSGAGILGDSVVAVPSGGEAEVLVAGRRGAVLRLRLDGESPSDVVVTELARDGEPWRTVMRLGGQRGRETTDAFTLEPGRWRWRVSFPDDSLPMARRDAAPPVEGSADLVEGVTTETTVLVR
jgi:RNA polymerase sigma-70 factor (ECF subfamily)